jgi:acetyltransferase-like isoleucine patch superfamily enzyme
MTKIAHPSRAVAVKIYKALALSRVSLRYRLFGIRHVSRELSNCSPLLIPDILRMYGANIGSGIHFNDSVIIDNADGDVDATGDFTNLTIGDNCYIGKSVFFDLPDQVEVQAGCAISAGVKFVTHSDCGNRPLSKWYPRQRGKIVVGRGSWIGVNAVILHGVILGECCVVAAGSVVTESFDDYCVLAGSPAHVVKRLAKQSEAGDPGVVRGLDTDDHDDDKTRR